MFSALRKTWRTERSPAAIRANLVAGLTVGIIALPLSMALAIACGVPPQHGLYTAIVAGIVTGLAGGSPVSISGPTAAFVVVLIPIVQQHGLEGLLLSGFLAGLILVLMGLARLGRLIEIVPYPVVVGFTAGIAVVIATLQVEDFLGLQVTASKGHYLDRVAEMAGALDTVRLRELLIGGTTLLILILWPRLKFRVPAHLVALFVAAVGAAVLDHLGGDYAISTIGTRFHYQLQGVSGTGIPPILPSLGWPTIPADAGEAAPGFSFELLRELLPAAMTIAVLGAIESLLCAVIADGMSGRRHDPNDELIGQGLGNLVAPLFGGIPATAAIARTAANVRAGATSPLASVTHSLFIILAIVGLAPALAYIPMSAMAALLLMVAWNMSEARHFLRIIRTAPRDDIVLLLTCFTLTVLFDMTVAVAVGMALAGMLFVRRSIDLTETVTLHPEHDNLAAVPGGIAIYDINGPLFFGSAHKALRSLTEVAPGVRVVILDMAEVSMLDMSAIVAMESIAANMSSRGVGLVISNLQPRMVLKLRRAGIRKRLGRIEFSRNMNEARRKAVAMLPDGGEQRIS